MRIWPHSYHFCAGSVFMIHRLHQSDCRTCILETVNIIVYTHKRMFCNMIRRNKWIEKVRSALKWQTSEDRPSFCGWRGWHARLGYSVELHPAANTVKIHRRHTQPSEWTLHNAYRLNCTNDHLTHSTLTLNCLPIPS